MGSNNRYACAKDTPSAKDTLALKIRLRLKKGLCPTVLIGGGDNE